MENSKQDKRPKRPSKVPSFETDPETQVERSIRYEHKNTVFIFIYQKERVLRQHLKTALGLEDTVMKQS